jgi:Fur family peroxide stress response transcriptional regulator
MAQTELQRRMDEWTVALRRAGVKVTQQRLIIFREAASRGDHPDVEAVFRAVRQELPTVSLDTVYRTLHLFVDLGLVSVLGLSGERTHFDANTRPHHHFVCRECGQAYDFYDPGFDVLDLPAGADDLGQVQSTHVEFRGVCSPCAAGQGKANKRG